MWNNWLLFNQVVPQLSSRGWVDPVPDALLLRKYGSAGTSVSVAMNSDYLEFINPTWNGNNEMQISWSLPYRISTKSVKKIKSLFMDVCRTRIYYGLIRPKFGITLQPPVKISHIRIWNSWEGTWRSPFMVTCELDFIVNSVWLKTEFACEILLKMSSILSFNKISGTV
jgi:hypothetical protein